MDGQAGPSPLKIGWRSDGGRLVDLEAGHFAEEFGDKYLTLQPGQVGPGAVLPTLAKARWRLGIYIGPADLSISLGLDPALAFTTDQLLGPIQRIVAACAEGGIVPGIHQITPTGVVRWAKAGMKLITLGSDTGLFMRAAVDDLREISSQLHWNLLSDQLPEDIVSRSGNPYWRGFILICEPPNHQCQRMCVS